MTLSNHEDLTTLFVLLLTPVLFIAELAPWGTLVVGAITTIWLSRQLYLSFKNRKLVLEKRAEERIKAQEDSMKAQEDRVKAREDSIKAQKEQELLDLQIRKAKRDLGEE